MIKTEKKYIAQDSPYKTLALAIAERAVHDYRAAVKSRDTAELENLRKFFTSEWFEMLCDIDGELIIATIDEEVAA